MRPYVERLIERIESINESQSSLNLLLGWSSSWRARLDSMRVAALTDVMTSDEFDSFQESVRNIHARLYRLKGV